MAFAVRVGLLLLALVLCVFNQIKTLALPLYRLLFAKKVAAVVRTGDSRFAHLDQVGYNFQANYVELADGAGAVLPRVHYVDEGQGNGAKGVVLLLHGEPTWSFLYRNMIKPLVDAGYRVVAPDFIGFGRSDKYSSKSSYTQEMHMRTLRLFVERLQLQNITMVCHDWGGLVGLCVLGQIPKRFSSLVLMNTALPTGEFVRESMLRAQHKAIADVAPFLLWRAFAAFWGTNLPIRFIFRSMLGLPQKIVEAYSAPFPDSTFKAGPAAWPLLVPLFLDDPVAPYMREAREQLKTWKKPTLVMFGDADPITRGADKFFCQLVPQAKVVPIAGGTHFLQETHPDVLSYNIISFLEGTPK